MPVLVKVPLAPPALVMVPPVIVQWYDMPGLAETDAVQPPSPEVTFASPLTTGVCGKETTETEILPGADFPVRGLETTSCSWAVVPAAPTV